MFSRYAILALWVPVLFGIVFALFGWDLAKFDNNLPPWTPVAAFVLACALFVVALTLGISAVRRCPDAAKAPPSVLIQSEDVSSRNQSGGLTAHTVNLRGKNEQP
jgi:uncharacterized membrane protein